MKKFTPLTGEEILAIEDRARGDLAARRKNADARDKLRLITTLRSTEKTLRDQLEDMDDRRAVDAAAAGRGTFLPADRVRRILDGASPLRVYREHRGLTLQALADRIGVGKSYLSQIETGRKNGSLKVMRDCAAALDVDLDDLV